MKALSFGWRDLKRIHASLIKQQRSAHLGLISRAGDGEDAVSARKGKSVAESKGPTYKGQSTGNKFLRRLFAVLEVTSIPAQNEDSSARTRGLFGSGQWPERGVSGVSRLKLLSCSCQRSFFPCTKQQARLFEPRNGLWF